MLTPLAACCGDSCQSEDLFVVPAHERQLCVCQMCSFLSRTGVAVPVGYCVVLVKVQTVFSVFLSHSLSPSLSVCLLVFLKTHFPIHQSIYNSEVSPPLSYTHSLTAVSTSELFSIHRLAYNHPPSPLASSYWDESGEGSVEASTRHKPPLPPLPSL